MDEARALVADQALWPRVRDFLWDFATQVHESWLGGLVAPNYQTLLASSRVKRLVLSSLRITPCFHTFPKDDWSRLLLLDGATLEEIAKWLGAVACAGDLRCVTDGATVRELKAALPGIYPDVFGYTMYFKGVDLAAKDAKSAKGRMSEDVVSTGLSIIVSLLDSLPEALSSRLEFKLPKGLCYLCVLCGENERPALDAAVKRLLKLKFPEAYKLCC